MPAAGLRRDGDERRALAQPPLELGRTSSIVTSRDVPLREHDRASSTAPCARRRRRARSPSTIPSLDVDQDERDVGALGRLERAQLRVVLDPLPLPALAAQARRVDEQERAAVALEHGVDRVARRARDLGDDRPLRADERVEERRLADVRPAEDRDADRVVADSSGAPRCRAAASTISSSRSPVFVAVQAGERERVAEAEPVELERERRPATGRRSCSRARAPACATRAGSRRAPRRPA